ncbi:unnamed protein product [Cuscuta campestris]|uniref:Uncharacterized protein n=1 Tax=Cuscuta campestris TaxID=132261 RepID=A0A484NJH2_9ASTE|nr:unnamed protein product [Cuscuta campestris]
MVTSAGIRDLPANSFMPFSLTWPNLRCHKLGEVFSSTAFNSLVHTFKCVLYKVQQSLPRATNKDANDTRFLYVENPFDVKDKNHGTYRESALFFSYYAN